MIDKITSFFITTAHAQGSTVSKNSFTNLFKFRSGGDGGIQSLFDLIIVLINWFLVAVGIIAFIYIVIYGIKYITSGGDAAKATEARNGIINALIGIIVIVLAFFLIRAAVGFGDNPTGP